MKRKTLVTLATFCCLLAAAIIFISCGHHHDDSTDATSGCTQIANVTKIYLFGSTDEHDGNLGGRTGADALLDADGNKPVACTTATHAFISVDANDSIANMPTTYCFPDNIKIYAPDGITIIADNWADLMDSSIDVSLMDAGLFPVGKKREYWWTGSLANGTLNSGNNANGWTENLDVSGGAYANAAATDSTWLANDIDVSSTNNGLVGLCY